MFGYPRKNQNDFQFARALDFKLYSVLEQHSCGKPILVFCSTRKGDLSAGNREPGSSLFFAGVVAAAEQLLKEYEQAIQARQKTPWMVPKRWALGLVESDSRDIESFVA